MQGFIQFTVTSLLRSWSSPTITEGSRMLAKKKKRCTDLHLIEKIYLRLKVVYNVQRRIQTEYRVQGGKKGKKT